jgi:hypothetical protein
VGGNIQNRGVHKRLGHIWLTYTGYLLLFSTNVEFEQILHFLVLLSLYGVGGTGLKKCLSISLRDLSPLMFVQMQWSVLACGIFK